MDVYNLILDRGYIGALEYASKIENKNYRLASEIDQIVCELFKIACGKTAIIRTAQRALPQMREFNPQTTEAPGGTTAEPAGESTQGGGSTPSAQSDYTGTPPEGSAEPTGLMSAAAAWASIRLKIKYNINVRQQKYLNDYKKEREVLKSAIGAFEKYNPAVKQTIIRAIKNNEDVLQALEAYFTKLGAAAPAAEAKRFERLIPIIERQKKLESLIKATQTLKKNFFDWITQVKVPKNYTELIELCKNLQGKVPNIPGNEKIIQFLAKKIKDFEIAAKVAADAAGAAGGASKAGGALAKVLEFLGKLGNSPIIKTLKGALESLSKSKILQKVIGPIALTIDSYDLITDYQREGASAKVICKVANVIAGVLSFFPATAPVAAPIWLLLSIGCNFIPSKTKADAKKGEYEGLTKEKVNQQMSSVSLNSLSEKDRGVVKDLFSNNTDTDSLMNNLKTLRSQRVFEEPTKSLAFIQKWLNQNRGQVKPL